MKECHLSAMYINREEETMNGFDKRAKDECLRDIVGCQMIK